MTRKQNSVLLLMDFQQGIVEPSKSSGSLDAVNAAKRALDHARTLGIPVFHVVVKFRPTYIDISDTNKRLAGIKSAGRLKETDAATAIVDALAPASDEPVIVKRRFSALAHTDLLPLLRAGRIEHLILCGLSTSGVILSTVRGAADEDFSMTVLSDACGDPDNEVHRLLIDKILPTQADVVSVDTFISTHTKSP